GVRLHRRASDGPYDVIVCFCPDQDRLHRRWPVLHPKTTPAGSLWIAWPKRSSGVPTDLDENVIRDYSLAHGRVDVKVCAVDDVPAGSWEEAMAAAEHYPGFAAHPFPTCYACGPRRPPGDGLRLFPGRLPDGRTAAPWVVPEDIEPAVVWAALDCPGGWSIAVESRPYVLG